MHSVALLNKILTNFGSYMTPTATTCQKLLTNSLGSRTANCQSIHTMPTLTKIKEAIPSTPVVMVSKSYCPFCRKAKDALKSFNLGSDMVVFEIENDSDMDAIQNEMAKMTGGRSVPRVFIGGQFVGGGDEMVKYKSNGKLAELISNARSG